MILQNGYLEIRVFIKDGRLKHQMLIKEFVHNKIYTCYLITIILKTHAHGSLLTPPAAHHSLSAKKSENLFNLPFFTSLT